MQNKIRKMIAVIFPIMLLISLLTGCGIVSEPIESTQGKIDIIQEKVETSIDGEELWVLTVNSGMKRIIEKVAERFEEEHSDVTIKITHGPENGEETDVWLEQLRTQIMAGEGPDLFLLPAENISSASPIQDANQFMRAGLCLDITDYYNNDEELSKSAFSSAVMDAGVVDGTRYVLPLRFNFPVIYAHVQQLEAHHLTVDDLQKGMSSLADLTQTLEPGAIGSDYGDWFFNLYWMNSLSQLINYEDQAVVLKKAELVEYLADYRTLTTWGFSISSGSPTLSSYVGHDSFWTKDGQYIFLGTLGNLAQNLRIAKAEGIDLATIPMRASDGSLIANISYYGAIGANTKHPDVAYEFLRQLLLEETQWMPNLEDMLEFGWPVLLEGSGPALDAAILDASRGNNTSDDARKRNMAIHDAQMSEEDFAILYTQPTAVRFLPAAQFDYMVEIGNKLNIQSNPDAMSVDVEALADEILQELNWEVAEG